MLSIPSLVTVIFSRVKAQQGSLPVENCPLWSIYVRNIRHNLSSKEVDL